MIFTLDEDSCAVGPVGNTGFADMRGLTSIDGELYGTRSVATWPVYRISTADGSATLVGNFGSPVGFAYGLAANGYRLYVPGFSSSSALYYLSLRDLTSGSDAFGNDDVTQATGAAVLTMIQASDVGTLTASVSGTSATLSWSEPTDPGTGSITGYSVQYQLDGASTWTGWTFDSLATTTVITGLSLGEDYNMRVAAINALGVGVYSTAAVNPTNVEPRVPQNLVLTPDNTEIGLAWEVPTSDGGSAITGYSVQYKASTSSTWIDWPRTANDTSTSDTITGLTNGTTYDVQVAAVNSVGTGDFTASQSATPNVTLSTPTGLALTPGTSTIEADWGDVTDATAYVIQWSTTSGTFNSTDQATPTASNHQIAGLSEGVTYYVRVRATATGAPDGPWSAESSTTTTISPLSQVTGLTATPSSTSTLDVDWSDATNATGYKIQWSVTSGAFSLTRQAHGQRVRGGYSGTGGGYCLLCPGGCDAIRPG